MSRPIKLGSNELTVLRSMLAHADELRWTLDVASDVDLELIDPETVTKDADGNLVSVISPDLVHRALSMAVRCVERAHDDVAAKADAVTLHIQANVADANMPTGHPDGPPLHRSHRDILAAVQHATKAARQTILTKARRLADRSATFKAEWAALDGTRHRGKRKRKDQV